MGQTILLQESQDGGQTNIDFCFLAIEVMAAERSHGVLQATPKRPLLRERSLATGRKTRALAKKHAENAE